MSISLPVFKMVFLFCLLFIFSEASYSISPLNPKLEQKNYEAIVYGKIVKKEVKKTGSSYITEYKLKVKKWLDVKPGINKTKFVIVKTLGAELPEKGIIIKASTAPDFIPINKYATFILVKNKLKQKDIFTIPRNGIIFESTKS